MALRHRFGFTSLGSSVCYTQYYIGMKMDSLREIMRLYTGAVLCYPTIEFSYYMITDMID